MTPRKTKNLRMPAQPAEPLRVVHPDAAAIDVHSEVHWVCVPADRDPQPVQKFGAFTVDLEALADFLSRSRTALAIASDRVKAKYGMSCSRAIAQLARIEAAAGAFGHLPDARVAVDAFDE